MFPTQPGRLAALRQARTLLQERGEVPAGLIREPLERSWRRSLDAGLDSGSHPRIEPLGRPDLAQALERELELIAHARPVLEYLHGQTRGSGSLAILADGKGVLLQALGDADFLSRAERVALAPGASWHEAQRGTNAIGTALAEGAALVVHGAEHFLERHGFLTCAAAPVAAPDGRLLGVLDISGDRRSAHPHTFCLVRTAAQMIENRLFEARHGADIRLRLHPLAEGIGTLAEGVLAVTEDGRIAGANRAALALLGLDAADLGTKPLALVLDLRLADLLDWGRRRPGEPLAVRMAGGGGLYLRVEPGRLALSLGLGSRTGRLPVPAPPPADALAAIDTGDTRTAAAVARVRRILAKPIPLLLLGESGVGKERFAAAVHRSGPRRAGPFVAVNCGALPEHLIESELFGYAPGAFTGARREGSAGRIRAAQGGTLFLDEIGDMPLGLQARLLRVLQEREVSPLGGARPVPVDFALTCATHHNLKAEMEAGRFRADLYYRINGLTLILPCLRERSDFAVLLARLIEEEAPGRGLALAPDLARAFAAYPWPGNLRQLANAVQIACALLDEGETQIGWQHLPDDLAADLASPPTPVPCAALGAGAGAGPGANLRALSDAAIRRTVADAGGNLSEAARRLGISRNTLYRRLRPAAAP